MKYTLGNGFVTNPYHVRVIQSSLTRSIEAHFADMKDEITTAFQEEIPLSDETSKCGSIINIISSGLTAWFCRSLGRGPGTENHPPRRVSHEQ